MAFNKALVCVVFCLALMALSSAGDVKAPRNARCFPKRQANPPCPSGYFYNEGKGECTNALLAGGGT